MLPSNGATRLVGKLLGVGVASAALALAPFAAGVAGAAPSHVASSAAAGPQCQLFSPLEGAFYQFEAAWNAQAGSQGAPSFGAPSFASSGQLPDIAGQMAAGSGCPISTGSSGTPAPPSGVPAPPSSGGGSGGPQCQLFSPLEGGIEQFEQAWNSQAGSQGAPEFGGKGPFPDIAAQMASGSGCPISSSSGGPGLPSAPSSGGGSSSAPQCALFTPLAAGVEQVEQGFDSGSGQSTFTGSNDIAAQILTGSGCAPTSGSGSNTTSGGGNTQSSTGSQGGSSGGGSATSPSSGNSGSSGGATLADNSVTGSDAGTGGGSGSLPFTGEPSWIPLAGLIALVLAAMAALAAIALRLAGRLLA
ncbi:MAG TPA: hypothetical protein VMV14_02455 [Acidimicrobiales bacterium]|nr:hypothetical protein [Acidimicrobiales bacterium]